MSNSLLCHADGAPIVDEITSTLHVAQPQFSVDNATGNAFGAAFLQETRG
ncbi:MAG: hypothetical protein ACLUPK_03240 [Veillonella sp.]